MAASTPIGIGKNRAREGMLLGQHSVIKQVNPAFAQLDTGRSDIAQVANAARYEAAAEAASHKVAEETGFGPYAPAADAFEYAGRHFVVSTYLLMQPSPRAETSRLLCPSLRFCIFSHSSIIESCSVTHET
jgi:hypothetical protein